MTYRIAILLLLPSFAIADEGKLTVKQEKVAIPTELDKTISALLDEEAIQVKDGRAQSIAPFGFAKRSLPRPPRNK